jgi:hypothetical protein
MREDYVWRDWQQRKILKLERCCIDESHDDRGGKNRGRKF